MIEAKTAHYIYSIGLEKSFDPRKSKVGALGKTKNTRMIRDIPSNLPKESSTKDTKSTKNSATRFFRLFFFVPFVIFVDQSLFVFWGFIHEH